MPGFQYWYRSRTTCSRPCAPAPLASSTVITLPYTCTADTWPVANIRWATTAAGRADRVTDALAAWLAGTPLPPAGPTGGSLVVPPQAR